MQILRFTIEEQRWEGERLDRVLAEYSGIARNRFKAQGAVLRCDGRACKLSHRVRLGSRVEVHLPDPPPSELVPEDIGLQLLFENERVLVIDKPAGLVVHPGAGNRSGTLANALAYHLGKAVSEFEVAGRPGIVHRLDKDTSGVLVAAKDPQALELLQQQFRERRVDKQYLALSSRPPQPSAGEIGGCIARDPVHRKRFIWTPDQGRPAHTRYRTIRSFGTGPDGVCLVGLQPSTGRTHQLRVHLKQLQAPIIGDDVYGGPRCADGLMLHAYSLRLVLPDESVARSFRAPLPPRMKALLTRARRSQLPGRCSSRD